MLYFILSKSYPLLFRLVTIFMLPKGGKHIVAALSVRPVLCLANNFKTTVGI